METIAYETIDNVLSEWQQYFDPEEFSILREFVYNTANHIPYNKMLIFVGPGSTGKTTLLRRLFAFIGRQNCLYSALKYKKEEDECNDEEDEEELIRDNNDCTKHLIAYDHDKGKIYDGYIKNILSRQPIVFRPLYQEKQCCIPAANIILVSDDISQLNKTLLMRSNVIHFTHKFK